MAREQRSTQLRLRTSYLSSVISTALVLFLLGVVGLLVFNANRLSSHLKDNIVVKVNIKEDVSEQQAMRFFAKIESNNYVRSAEYISKDEAMRRMQEELGTDFKDMLENNPFPTRFEITMKTGYFSADSVASIKNQLLKYPEVKDVFYEKSLLEAVSQNTEKITTIIMIFVILLMFVSLFLINNTIRLSIYSKRFLINTMKLVGANTSFIRTPFLASSVWQGLLSGFIAILLLLGFIAILRRDFSQLLALTDARMFAALFAIILILGSLISFISTYFIVTKYTKINTEDLYY